MKPNEMERGNDWQPVQQGKSTFVMNFLGDGNESDKNDDSGTQDIDVSEIEAF